MKAKKKSSKKAAKSTAKKAVKKSSKVSIKKDTSRGTSAIGLSPLSDKVLIRLFEEGEANKVLPSGIIIPETVDKEKADRGEVVAVGPGKFDEDGERRIPMGVSVGDKVLFQWGDKIEFGGKEYYLVGEGNILAVIN